MILSSHDKLYNRRVTKASSALVIRLPFFGYLLFGSTVKVVEDSIATMATDGAKIYCGVEFVKTEDFDIVMFGLLHELLHIYFNHHARRGDRDPKTWNIAADMFVNEQCGELLGSEDGDGKVRRWPIPKRFIQPVTWAAGKTVEEIYEIIKKQEEQTPGISKQYLPKPKGSGEEEEGEVAENQDEIGNGGDMREPEGGMEPSDEGMTGPQADPEFQSSFRQDIAHAKALAERSPLQRKMTGHVHSRMDKILRPTLPWGSLVRGNVANDLGWDEATYCPPKTKYYPIILPQTRKTVERKLLLGIDVSASMTDALVRICITNVQAAAQRATEIIIVVFDAIVREVHRTKRPRDIYSKVKFVSGAHSHTSAMGLFEIAKKEKPSAICIMTDGYIDIPDLPVRNTTFVIPEGGNVLPWGKTFVMEHPWR